MPAADSTIWKAIFFFTSFFFFFFFFKRKKFKKRVIFYATAKKAGGQSLNIKPASTSKDNIITSDVSNIIRPVWLKQLSWWTAVVGQVNYRGWFHLNNPAQFVKTDVFLILRLNDRKPSSKVRVWKMVFGFASSNTDTLCVGYSFFGARPILRTWSLPDFKFSVWVKLQKHCCFLTYMQN